MTLIAGMLSAGLGSAYAKLLNTCLLRNVVSLCDWSLAIHRVESVSRVFAAFCEIV